MGRSSYYSSKLTSYLCRTNSQVISLASIGVWFVDFVQGGIKTLLMVIELTDEAIKKLLEKTSDNKNIKIGVKASGCNGFKYLFDYLNDDPKEDDIEMNYGKFSIWIDQLSVEYLYGMTLDYQFDGINEGFTFINPNASAYCGCGESFTI